MLRFSLTFSNSSEQAEVASLRVYCPGDELVTIPFRDAAELIRVLKLLKQDDLVRRVREFFRFDDPGNQASRGYPVTNEAIA